MKRSRRAWGAASVAALGLGLAVAALDPSEVGSKIREVRAGGAC